MTQIPLLSGVTASGLADYNLSYPVNLEPVGIENGISKGYLRSAFGTASFGTGPGIDRGGIVWNNAHYRVMGSKLVSVSAGGTVTTLGDVGDDGKPVSLDYSFALLAIRSGTSLYFWNGSTLTQVTDPDLGQCKDIAWFKGQFFSTDGQYVVALQLADPTQVDPNKYGSAESDPDPVVGLLRLRNELYVLGGSTIEVFFYTGGSGFPLTVSDGATIPIGCVGVRAKCIFSQSFAFVGAARGNAPGVWLASAGSAVKLSTRIIDDYLAAEPDLSSIQLEARVLRDEQRLYVHLSDRTLIYCLNASQKAQQEVWYVAQSGRGMDKAYRLRNAVFVDGKFIVGDTESSALGQLVESEASHFGEAVGWRFDTVLLYNAAKSGIVHSLELVGLPGRHSSSPEPTAFLSYTTDGETWSIERASKVGKAAQRNKRVVWTPHKRFRNYMGLRFRGDSSALLGVAALEPEIEALAA